MQKYRKAKGWKFLVLSGNYISMNIPEESYSQCNIYKIDSRGDWKKLDLNSIQFKILGGDCIGNPAFESDWEGYIVKRAVSPHCKI